MKALIAGSLLIVVASLAAAQPPQLKFNEVKEVAPGVFFRYSSISATDKSVVFGGSNNIWVVFEDYVAVIDANFPKEAGDVIAAIKKTTDKPIRYVFDTHHHGDHAYGNAVFVQEGASVVAQSKCAQLLRIDGPKQFADAGKGPTGRKDVAGSVLKVPSVIFDDKLVLEDGKGQRLEFLFFGHGHTAGDACAYLPKHKLLCTGDACVNGAFNFMGHSDSASWIKALEKMQQLEVDMVLPGHGLPTDKKLLDTQKRYFVELRQQVKKGLDAGKELADIQKAIDLPWYKEWTGVTPPPPNVEHVFKELTGVLAPWDLAQLPAGPSFKDTPGWTPPKRIVVPAGLMPARIAELKRLAPEIEFVPVRNETQAAQEAIHADAVLGFCTPAIVTAGKKLRWLQVDTPDQAPELAKSEVVVTATPRFSGPDSAERQWRLYRENVRRFAAGEALLGVVEK